MCVFGGGGSRNKAQQSVKRSLRWKAGHRSQGRALDNQRGVHKPRQGRRDAKVGSEHEDSPTRDNRTPHTHQLPVARTRCMSIKYRPSRPSARGWVNSRWSFSVNSSIFSTRMNPVDHSPRRACSEGASRTMARCVPSAYTRTHDRHNHSHTRPPRHHTNVET